MTKAAEELFVSQSSLSQYLSRLEQEIGAPLFIRAKGELLLTPAGEEYVKAAQKVIQIQRELYDSIRSQNHKSHITIGVTSQFGLRMLTQIIPPYKKEYPQVTIELSESNVPSITKMIRDESIDCAVMALNNTDSFSPDQVKIVREEEVYLAIPISHPYREKIPTLPSLMKILSSLLEMIISFSPKRDPLCARWRIRSFLLPILNQAPCARPTASSSPGPWWQAGSASPSSPIPA